MLCVKTVDRSVQWLGGRQLKDHGVPVECIDNNLLFICRNGCQVVASQHIMCLVSRLIPRLIRKQGFCSGCNQRIVIILPWVSSHILSMFVKAIQEYLFVRSEAELIDKIQAAIKGNEKNNQTVLPSSTTLKSHDIEQEMRDLMDELYVNPENQDRICLLLPYLARRLNDENQLPVTACVSQDKTSPSSWGSCQIRLDKGEFCVKHKQNNEVSNQSDMQPCLPSEDELVSEPTNQKHRSETPVHDTRDCLEFQSIASICDGQQLVDNNERPPINNIQIDLMDDYEQITGEINVAEKAKKVVYCPNNTNTNFSDFDIPSSVKTGKTIKSSIAGSNSNLNVDCLDSPTNITDVATHLISPERQESSKKELGTSYNHCGICKQKLKLNSIYDHYSFVHFKKELTKVCHGSSKCPICLKTVGNNTEKQIIRHIGDAHRGVEAFLDKKFHVGLRRASLKSLEIIRQRIQAYQDPLPINKTQKLPPSIVNVNKDKSKRISECYVKAKKLPPGGFEVPFPVHRTKQSLKQENKKSFINCGICHQKLKTKSIYTHYSVIHYKQELTKVFTGSSKCPLCQKSITFKTEKQVIRHIGDMHRGVEAFLDKRLHVGEKRATFKSLQIIKQLIKDQKPVTINKQSMALVDDTELYKEKIVASSRPMDSSLVYTNKALNEDMDPYVNKQDNDVEDGELYDSGPSGNNNDYTEDVAQTIEENKNRLMDINKEDIADNIALLRSQTLDENEKSFV